MRFDNDPSNCEDYNTTGFCVIVVFAATAVVVVTVDVIVVYQMS